MEKKKLRIRASGSLHYCFLIFDLLVVCVA